MTVTVPDSGVGFDVVPPELEVPLPQAVRQTRLSAAAAHRIQTLHRRRFLRRMKHNVSAMPATGVYWNGLGSWFIALILVVNVSVVEAVAPDGVMGVGEKLHDVPAGKPEQLNDTDELNPFCGVIRIVLVPLCPGTTVSDVGEAAIEKSGGAGDNLKTVPQSLPLPPSQVVP